MNDLVSKWNTFGLLSELSVEKKLVLAPLYEEMISYIVGLKLVDKNFG